MDDLKTWSLVGVSPPGPWAMPPAVEEALRPWRLELPPRYHTPLPPRSDPAATPADQVTLALTAWAAASCAYGIAEVTRLTLAGLTKVKPRPIARPAVTDKLRGVLVEAMALLSRHHLRPHAWAYWSYHDLADPTGTKHPPIQHAFAAKRIVLAHEGAMAKTRGLFLPREVLTPTGKQLSDARAKIDMALHRARPATAEAALGLVEAILPQAELAPLRAQAEAEVEKLRLDTANRIAKGYWIWT